MQIYITKYLFTNGIELVDAEISDKMAIVGESNSYQQYFHGEGREWHRTKESAIARAEEMRIKKLKAIDKQMKKISAMKFE